MSIPPTTIERATTTAQELGLQHSEPCPRCRPEDRDDGAPDPDCSGCCGAGIVWMQHPGAGVIYAIGDLLPD